MKKFIVLGVFASSVILGGHANADAVRLLQVIPECDGFKSVKKVNEIDHAADSALHQAEAALQSIDTLDQTCSTMAADSSYNSDVPIRKLIKDSQKATQTAVFAVKALDKASKQVTAVGQSLIAIGPPKKCVDQVRSTPGKLEAKKKEVEMAMKKVESCVNRTPPAGTIQ